jgi:hypothetical protein
MQIMQWHDFIEGWYDQFKLLTKPGSIVNKEVPPGPVVVRGSGKVRQVELENCADHDFKFFER